MNKIGIVGSGIIGTSCLHSHEIESMIIIEEKNPFECEPYKINNRDFECISAPILKTKKVRKKNNRRGHKRKKAKNGR